ncbi:MAG: class I SAM-dependent methyltransferase [Lysobacterales bacterium]
MKHDPGAKALREGWNRRQEEFGDAPRAVLMKGVPDAVNLTIDRWHRQVLRFAFGSWQGHSEPVLDVGCGYGRLGNEALAIGMQALVGIDFSPAFCRRFATACGPAVCGDISQLSFSTNAFAGAYVVTALMYLDVDRAGAAMRSLDACLAAGARVLVLEPGAEFNGLVRSLLRHKQDDSLARPGFTSAEFKTGLVPANWRKLYSGANAWMTLLFPLLLIADRRPRLYAAIERFVLRLDRPVAGRSVFMGRYALYRWAVYESGADSGEPGLRSTQT